MTKIPLKHTGESQALEDASAIPQELMSEEAGRFESFAVANKVTYVYIHTVYITIYIYYYLYTDCL